jgi:hypothetical protein
MDRDAEYRAKAEQVQREADRSANELAASTAVELTTPVPLPKLGKNKKWGQRAMKDYLAHAEKLRKEAAECALIRDLATDKAKREMFDRLVSHLTVLADRVEMAMLERKNSTKQGRLC